VKPSRVVPLVGRPARILELGAELAATVIAVDGPSVVVQTGAGEEITFDLHANTGHWVRRGDPYWGVRLVLSPAAASPDGS
jgi:hypothetical protein